MRCQNVSNRRNVVFDDLMQLTQKGFTKDMNLRIITSSIRFIKDNRRFGESLSS